MSVILTTARDTLKTLIEANAYCSDLYVITEAKGNLLNQLTRALGSVGGPVQGKKAGIAIVILQAVARVYDQKMRADSGKARSTVLSLEIVIAVFENYIVNVGTGGANKPCITVAENIAAAIQWERNGLDEVVVPGLLSGYFYLDDNAITFVPNNSETVTSYHVNCHTYARLLI